MGGEDAGEQEEDINTIGDTGNTILPGYVIALQATDDFLCDRIMALPEKELQVIH